MKNVRIEDCLGHPVRFVERQPDDWWAVAEDVATALGYNRTSHMLDLIDRDEKDTACLADTVSRRWLYVVISEFGIYEALFNSEREEAKDFKKWTKQVLKELRQSAGLEGFKFFGTTESRCKFCKGGEKRDEQINFT